MFRKILICASLLFAVLLAVANVWFGELNLDEGWYLNAALCVRRGMLPYRDFFFTQAPLLPVVYGALSDLWASHGVLGGRLLTAALGLCAAMLAAFAVRPLVPGDRRVAASLTLFLLLAGNVYHSYFTVIPKTYALASLFLSGGLLCFTSLSTPGQSRGRSALAAFGCGLAFAAAAATRLSLGVALAITGLYLLAGFRKYGWGWLYFGIGGALGLAVFIGIFAARDIEAFKFANFFHGARESGGLMLTLGSMSRLARNYMPALVLGIVTCAIAAIRGRMNARQGIPEAVALVAVFAGIFVVHALSPFPYDDYQVPGMTILLCAVATLFWNALPGGADEKAELRVQNVVLASFLAMAVAFAGSSPLNETWVMLRKDRFWVEMKKTSDLSLLRKTAREIAELVPEGEQILTQDTYLAVEAGRAVPAGFEMGPFGYFTELDDATAARFHVLNRNLAAKAIAESGAPVAAASGYSFAMAAPAMSRIDQDDALSLLPDFYEELDPVADFGQEHTALRIWKRK